MKLLSRKVLASLLVFITATIFVWFGKIPSQEWVQLAIVTVMAYIAGDGISAVVKYFKYTKRASNAPLAYTLPTGDTATFAVRIKNLLDSKFLAAIFVYGVATFLMWNGKITTTEWNYVAMGTILGYDLVNPLGK